MTPDWDYKPIALFPVLLSVLKSVFAFFPQCTAFLVPSFLRFFVSAFFRFFVSSFLRFFVSSFLRVFVPSSLRSFVPTFLRSFFSQFFFFHFYGLSLFAGLVTLVVAGSFDLRYPVEPTG